MIAFHQVKKTYVTKDQTIAALDGVDLTIEKGEIFGVIGFSGAGKSSLLRCVNLLERPTSGTVTVDGEDLTQLSPKKLRQAKQRIGMIFQHFNLLNANTVFTNVAKPLVLAGVKKDEIRRRVTELLEFVDLADKADHYPDQLSGGQKQRVGIARALATQPSVLLCDEATSALDPQTTHHILQLLKRINAEYGITILLITHEMGVIREICDRVAVIEAGKLIESGTVFDVFSNPQTETAKNFVRSVMHDEIPASIRQLIESRSAHPIYKIHFLGHHTGQPLLSQVAKRFDVDVNILHGSITELQETPFGTLLVELIGEPAEVKRALHYIDQAQVTVEEVLAHAS
ncbi:methionine ABC transporter ATP-binding protein [Exiguobacterium sp. TBG-PICH-001]|uniref:methionine ABC transporter ATP-binding protein n=1 Tax=Exiguobacterium abrahamii TaxID=2785532 RepID=UPI0018A742D0|nr:methionine ABC transporter ATP-binding protein [Exiguobacterium sp. TBG-PICH-001]MBF8151726.1 methionine ABC transporter ATP-binding protein [Exiguobacterium sp. TBG-PICH-001]